MKKGNLLLLIIALIAVCSFLFTTFYAQAKKAAVKKLNEEQLIHAKQAAHGIEDFFATWTGILNSLSAMSDIIPDFPLADLVDYADKVGGLAALAHSPANHARFRLGTDSRRRSLPGLPCHLAPIANTKPCSVDNVC